MEYGAVVVSLTLLVALGSAVLLVVIDETGEQDAPKDDGPQDGGGSTIGAQRDLGVALDDQDGAQDEDAELDLLF